MKYTPEIFGKRSASFERMYKNMAYLIIIVVMTQYKETKITLGL